jgi:hypothetical protein
MNTNQRLASDGRSETFLIQGEMLDDGWRYQIAISCRDELAAEMARRVFAQLAKKSHCEATRTRAAVVLTTITELFPAMQAESFD